MKEENEKKFEFSLLKIYDVPELESMMEFVKSHLSDDVSIPSMSFVYKRFSVVFVVKDSKKENEKHEE